MDGWLLTGAEMAKIAASPKLTTHESECTKARNLKHTVKPAGSPTGWRMPLSKRTQLF